MANSVTIQLQVNLRGITKVNELNTAMKSLQKSLSGMMGGGSAATGMNRTGEAASRAAGSINKLAKSFVGETAAARKATAEAERNYQKNKAAQDRTTAAVKGNISARLAYYEKEYDAIFRAGFRIQMIGNQIKSMGQAGIGKLADLTNSFGDFEFMINRAAGAMGIVEGTVTDGTDLYAKFSSTILDAANQLRLFDPTDVAKATYYWASTSGQQVDSLESMKKAMSAVIPLMKEAALTETDYQTTIKGVYSILIQYNKGVDQVADVTAKLQRATVETAAEFPDLINSFKMVGPIAAANNVSFEEMTSIFGRLADAGIKGTMAGRAFRQMFIQLAKPSEKAKAILTDLAKTQSEAFGGKSYAEAVFPEGQFIGPIKYINILAKATKDMTSEQRNALLASISTSNELPVLTALVRQEIDVVNKVSGAWEKNTKVTETAAQAFDRQWNQLRNSWKGTVGAITVGIETLKIQLGGRLAKILAPVLDGVIEQFGRIRKWIDDPRNSDMIDLFLKGAAAVSVFLVALGSAAVVLGGTISAFAALMVTLKGIGPMFGAFSGIIAVVTALGKAVIDNFDYIKSAVASAIEDINDAMGGSADGVSRIKDVFGQMGDYVKPILGFLVRGAADLVRAFGGLVKSLSGLGPVTEVLGRLGQVLLVVLSARTVSRVLGLGKAFGGLTTFIKGGLVPIQYLSRETGEWTNAMGTQGSIIERTTGRLTGLKSAMAGASGGFGKLRAGMGNVVGGLSTLMGGPLGLIALVVTVGALAVEHIPAIKNAFTDWGKATRELGESFGSMEKGLQDAFRNTPEYIRLAKELADAQNAPRKPLDDLFGTKNFEAGSAQSALDKAEFNNMQPWKIAVEELSKEMSVSSEEFVKWGLKVASSMGYVDAGVEKSIPLTRAYFRARQTATENDTSLIDALKRQFDSLSDAEKMGANGKVINVFDYITWNTTLDERQRDAADKGMQAIYTQYMGSFSNPSGVFRPMPLPPAVADAIQAGLDKGNLGEKWSKWATETLRTGVMSGIGALGDGEFSGEIKEASGRTMSQISKDILAGATEFMDFEKNFQEILDNYINPEETYKAVLHSFFGRGNVAQAGMNIPKPALDMLSDTVAKLAKSMGDNLTRAGGPDSPEGKKIISNLNKMVSDTFLQAVPKNLPQDARDSLYNLVKIMYDQIGVPVPQETLDKIYGKGKKIAGEMGIGVNEGVEFVCEEAENLVHDVNECLKPGPNDGKDQGEAFAWQLGGGIITATPVPIKAAKDLASAVSTSFNPGSKPQTQGNQFAWELGIGITAGAPASTQAAKDLAAAVNTSLNPGSKPKTEGGKVPSGYGGGITDGTPLGVAAAAALVNSVNVGLYPGSEPKTQGGKVPSGYGGGITAGASVPTQAAIDLAAAVNASLNPGSKPEAQGNQFAWQLGGGITKGAPVPTQAALDLAAAVNASLNPGSKPDEHGSSVTSKFREGMSRNKDRIDGVIDSVNDKVGTLAPGAGPGDDGLATTGNFGGGLATPRNLDRIRRTIEIVQDTIRRMNLSDASGSWGSHLVSNIIAGMRSRYTSLTTAVNTTARIISSRLALTVAEKGPLHTVDKWGGHLIQNIIEGMKEEDGNLGRQVSKVANTLSSAVDVRDSEALTSGLTLESSAKRVIKVEVDVSSKDGSVSKMTTSQLEQSIMTSDLILSLEHLSTVG